MTPNQWPLLFLFVLIVVGMAVVITAFLFSPGGTDIGKNVIIYPNGDIVTRGRIVSSNVSSTNNEDIQQNTNSISAIQSSVTSLQNQVTVFSNDVTSLQNQTNDSATQIETFTVDVSSIQEKTSNISVDGGVTTITGTTTVAGDLSITGNSTTNDSVVTIYSDRVEVIQNTIDPSVPALSVIQSSSATGPIILVTDGDSNTVFEVGNNGDVYTSSTFTSATGFSTGTGLRSVTFSVDGVSGNTNTIGNVTVGGEITAGEVEATTFSAENVSGFNSGDQLSFSSIGGVTATSTTASLNLVGGSGVSISTSGNDVTFDFNNVVVQPLVDKTQYIEVPVPGTTLINSDVVVNGNLNAINFEGNNTGDQNLFSAVGSIVAEDPGTVLQLDPGFGIEITSNNSNKTIELSFDSNVLLPLNTKVQNMSSTVGNTIFSGTVEAGNVSGDNTGDQVIFNSIGGVTPNSTATSLNLVGGSGINVSSTSSDVSFTFNDSVLTSLESKTQYFTAGGGVVTFTSDIDAGSNSITASNLRNSNTGDQNLFSSIGGVNASSTTSSLNIVANSGLSVVSNNVDKSLTFSIASGTASTLANIESKTTFLTSGDNSSTFTGTLQVDGDLIIEGSTVTNNSQVNIHNDSIQIIQNNPDGVTPALLVEQIGTSVGPIMVVKDGDSNTVFSVNQNSDVTTDGGIITKGEFKIGTDLLNPSLTINDGNLTTSGTISASNLQGSNTGDQNSFATIGGVTATTKTSTLNFVAGSGVTITNPTSGTVEFSFDDTVLASLEEKTAFISSDGVKTDIGSNLHVNGNITATNAINTNSGDQFLFSTIGGVLATSTTSTLNLVGGTGVTITPDNANKTIDFAFDNSVLAPLDEKTENISAVSGTTNFVGTIATNGAIRAANLSGENSGDQFLFSTIEGITATSKTSTLNLVAGTGVTITSDNANKTIDFAFDNSVLAPLEEKTANISAVSGTTNFTGEINTTGAITAHNLQGSNTGDQDSFATIGGVTATTKTSTLNFVAGTGVTITNPTPGTVEFSFDDTVLASLEEKTAFISSDGVKTIMGGDLHVNGNITATNVTNTNSGDQFLFSTIEGITATSKTSTLNLVGENGVTITSDNSTKTIDFAFDNSVLDSLEEKTANISAVSGTTNFTGEINTTGAITAHNLQGSNTGDQTIFTAINVGSESINPNSTATTLNFVPGLGVNIVGDDATKSVTFSFDSTLLQNLNEKTIHLSADATTTTIDSILSVGGNLSAANLTGSNSGDQTVFSSIGGVSPTSTATSLALNSGTGVNVGISGGNVALSFNDTVLDSLNDKTAHLSATGGVTTISSDVTITGPLKAHNFDGSNTGDQNAFTTIEGVTATSKTSSVGFVNGGNILISSDNTNKEITLTFDQNALNDLNSKTLYLSSTPSTATITGGLKVNGDITGSNLQNTNTGDQFTFTNIDGVTTTSTSGSIALTAGTGVTLTPDNTAKSITFGFDSSQLQSLESKTQNLSATSTESTFSNELIVQGDLTVNGTTTSGSSEVNIYDGYISIVQNPASGTTPALEITQTGTTTGPIMKVTDGDSNTIFEISQNANVYTDGTLAAKGNLSVGSNLSAPTFSVDASTGNVSTTGNLTATSSVSVNSFTIGGGAIEGGGGFIDVYVPIVSSSILTSTGNFTINTDSLTVDATTGDATFKGKLTANSFVGIQASDVPDGIDAAHIGDGNVSNIEFSYLSDVTSPIQGQLTTLGNNITTLEDKTDKISHSGTTTTVTGDLTVTGAETVSGNLTVTGGVTATSYSGIQAANIPTGIDATRIGNGLVDNITFGYLSDVTSPINTQITGFNNRISTLQDQTQLLSTTGGTSTIGGNVIVTGGATANSFVGIQPSNVPSGIGATSIGNGLVDNIEFSYLSDVTAPIQGQFTTLGNNITTVEGRTNNLTYTTNTEFDSAINITGGVTATSFVGIQPSNVPGGIDATSIGAGAVDNIEFSYLSDVTSPIQGQFTTLGNNITTLEDKTVKISRAGTTTTVTGNLTVTDAETVSGNVTATGGVTATSYSGIQASNLPPFIDANKFGSNVVDNFAFNSLEDTSAPIQGQIDTLTGRVTDLQTKTSTMSYLSGTNTMQISTPLTVTGAITSTGTGTFSSTITASNIGTIATLPIPTTERIVYVSGSGNNSNTGRTPYNAKLTIAGALAVVDGSGWQLIILPGTYTENVTITTPNLTVSGNNYETGGLCFISGTVTVSNTTSSIRIQGLKIDTIVHTSAGSLYLSNVDTVISFSSTGSGYIQCNDCNFQGLENAGSITFSTAGTRVFTNSQLGSLTISNSSVLCSMTGCTSLPVTLTQGTLGIINSTVVSTAPPSNAITTNSGSTLILVGATISYNNGASGRMSIAGFYSFREAFFDNTNSSITGTRIATPLNTDQLLAGAINVQSLSFNKLTPTTGAVVDLGDSTTSIIVPKGTTGQQPSGTAGMLRYNTTTSQFEGFTSTWGSIGGGSFNPTITAPTFGDVITYDSINGVWTNALVPAKSPPTVTTSSTSFTVTVTAPVLLLNNVNVSTYKLQVASDINFNTIVYDSPFQATGTFNLVSVVVSGTTYYLRGTIRTDLNNKLTQWSTTVTWTSPAPGAGAFTWSTRLTAASGADTNVFTNSSAISDSGNNTYYIGSYNSALSVYNADGSQFGSALTLTNNTCMYIVKYNTNGACQWATRIFPASGGSVSPQQIICDSSDNIYIAFYSSSSPTMVSVGGATITRSNSGNTDAYLCKYNSSGVCQWAVRIGGASFDGNYNNTRVVVDTNGNIIVYGGTASSSVSFFSATDDTTAARTISYITTGSYSQFVAKYNTSGAYQWATKMEPNTNNNYMYDMGIKLDSSNDIYVLFRNSGTTLAYNANVGGSPVLSRTLTFEGTGQNIGLVKFSTSNGAVSFGNRITGNLSVSNSTDTLIIDSTNRVTVFCNFSSATATIYNPSDGPTPLTATNTGANGNALVVSYSNTGSPIWRSNWSCPSASSNPWCGSADSSGNIFIGARIDGATTIVNGDNSSLATINMIGLNNTIIAKYNNSGVVQWYGRVGNASSNNIPRALIVDNLGNAYVSVQIAGGAATVYDKDGTAYGTVLGNDGSNDVGLIKFSSAGLVLWADRLGSTASDFSLNVIFDRIYSNYITGTFGTTPLNLYNTSGTNVGTVTGISATNSIFIAKLF